LKILYITPVPFEEAGCRFRIHQYIPYLKSRGFKCSVSPFLFKEFFKIAYRRGMTLRKIMFFAVSCARRLFDLLRALNYDVVVIYRESFPFGPALFESVLHIFNKKLIFDFDDAIFFPDVSDVNKVLLRLRFSRNPDKIIKMSRVSIAGNSYFKEYALKFNKNVLVIPIVIDTEKFRSLLEKKIIIGWVGTISTQKYLLPLKNIFRKLMEKYSNIEIRIIGAQLENEIKDIQDFSIGIMPLSDNEWARGKCGFKIIQYMSCGVPAIASGVGNNNEIIQDGLNGLLVHSQDEWMNKISSLIESRELRLRLGSAGRRFVEEGYSLKRYAPRYCEIVKRVLNES